MASRRLTNSEKKEILSLYRNPEETTSTLASRYGVSNSTISRILKNGLEADDYEALVQQKRSGVPKPQPSAAPNPAAESLSEGTAARTSVAPVEDIFARDITADEAADQEDEESPNQDFEGKPQPRRRRRRSHPAVPDTVTDTDDVAEPTPTAPKPPPVKISKANPVVSASVDDFDPRADDEDWFPASEPYGEADEEEDYHEHEGGLAHPFEDEMLDGDEDDDEDFDDLEDDDGLDDEGAIADRDEEFRQLQFQAENFLSVLPFSEAQLPKTCYLVIDRAAELITRPLSDFTELGHVPSDDEQAKTLPIFDNHRVAKRFSNRRTQRIIKVPDSHLLQKTTSYLQAKGITRLLFDGQVYSLVE